MCGSFGDISTFSFYANKQLTTGEGGMISTNNKKLYDRCKTLRNLCFGKKQRFNHDDIGWNYRITNIQAALGLGQLKRLNSVVKRKMEIGNYYFQRLSKNKNIYITPPKISFSKNIYWVVGIVIKNKKVWKILHHMQGTPQTMQIKPTYKNVLLDIYDFFEESIKNKKIVNKISKKIILDPGIGFGKNLKHNLMLMSKISIFHSLGFPILIGASRKKFISQISEKFDSIERIGGTLSTVLSTLAQGVQIFRVHNVKEVKQGILVYKKLLNQWKRNILAQMEYVEL